MLDIIITVIFLALIIRTVKKYITRKPTVKMINYAIITSHEKRLPIPDLNNFAEVRDFLNKHSHYKIHSTFSNITLPLRNFFHRTIFSKINKR